MAVDNDSRAVRSSQRVRPCGVYAMREIIAVQPRSAASHRMKNQSGRVTHAVEDRLLPKTEHLASCLWVIDF